MVFPKKALTIPEQLQRLEERGLTISDKEKAAHYLCNISYYRLSAYWFTFLTTPKSDHRFGPNSTFDQVLDTYVFDRKLRILIFDEIERIEIALRTQLIYHYCHQFGNNWYENKTLFRNPSYYHKFQTLMLEEMNRTSEVFITHYRNKYTDPANPPAWMVLELASFGQLSLLYKNLRSNKAHKSVAKHFGVHENVLESWLECLAYVRNTCAHHMRFWNRKMPKSPILPSIVQGDWITEEPEKSRQNRVYTAFCVIRYLLGRIIPETSFTENLLNLLNDHPAIPVYYMGFTKDWKDEPLWKN